MVKASVSLRVNNLKEIKMGYQQTNLYLAFHTVQNDYLITSCKNILFDESPFKIENMEAITKIELWNYDTHKRIATVFVRDDGKRKEFEYTFKNHNIRLVLAWPEEQKTVSSPESSSSTEKADSEESRSTYHNLSSEEEL